MLDREDSKYIDSRIIPLIEKRGGSIIFRHPKMGAHKIPAAWWARYCNVEGDHDLVSVAEARAYANSRSFPKPFDHPSFQVAVEK